MIKENIDCPLLLSNDCTYFLRIRVYREKRRVSYKFFAIQRMDFRNTFPMFIDTGIHEEVQPLTINELYDVYFLFDTKIRESSYTGVLREFPNEEPLKSEYSKIDIDKYWKIAKPILENYLGIKRIPRAKQELWRDIMVQNFDSSESFSLNYLGYTLKAFGYPWGDWFFKKKTVTAKYIDKDSIDDFLEKFMLNKSFRDSSIENTNKEPEYLSKIIQKMVETNVLISTDFKICPPEIETVQLVIRAMKLKIFPCIINFRFNDIQTNEFVLAYSDDGVLALKVFILTNGKAKLVHNFVANEYALHLAKYTDTSVSYNSIVDVRSILMNVINVFKSISSKKSNGSINTVTESDRCKKRNECETLKSDKDTITIKLLGFNDEPLTVREFVKRHGTKHLTHKSPVTHRRSGHYRHYKSGKVVFIEATTVNGDKNSMIKYSLKE